MRTIVLMYRLLWWHIQLHFCDLGDQIIGKRWIRLNACRIHGYAKTPDAPEWMWKLFGWAW